MRSAPARLAWQFVARWRSASSPWAQSPSGALAIGRLSIGRVRIRRLEVDELVVRRLRTFQSDAS